MAACFHGRVLFELIWRDYFRFVSIKYGNAIFHIGELFMMPYFINAL